MTEGRRLDLVCTKTFCPVNVSRDNKPRRECLKDTLICLWIPCKLLPRGNREMDRPVEAATCTVGVACETQPPGRNNSKGWPSCPARTEVALPGARNFTRRTDFGRRGLVLDR